jgi:hypothetical protein
MGELQPGVATWAAPTLEQQIVRWRAIEQAAREVIGETVIVGDNDDSFATFDKHFVMVEKYAVEALRSSLGEKVDG